MRRRSLLVLFTVCAMLAAEREPRADDGGPGGRRTRVVARVGPAAVTVGELEERIGRMPPFQRTSFGATADVVRHRFLNEVVVRELLLARGAEQQSLGDKPPAKFQIERAISASTVRATRALVGPATAISMEDVQRYYDEHRERFDTPERIQIWRILCKSREEAQSVLEAAKREPTPLAFEKLAREHSLDKATNLRAGNLGFLTADGNSREPGLRVEPSVVRAAQGVRDGTIVGEPVPEGDGFSVVWRRGTIAATKRTVGDVAAQIRDSIWKARVKSETDKLVASLRAAKLRGLDVTPLESLPIVAVGATDAN